jgi:putative spermidine/putrescine transport system permease protein
MNTGINKTTAERAWRRLYLVICAAIFAFLVLPLLVIVPLSFNAEPYFSFTAKMATLDPEGYSLRWYDSLLTLGMEEPTAPRNAHWWADVWANAVWIDAAKKSLLIGFWATLLATALGTAAALGLSSTAMPWRRFITAALLSPMIVPIIVVATGLSFFYSSPCGMIGYDCGRLTSTTIGVVLAHAILGVPFVVISVTAALAGFDRSLSRAAESLGASPTKVFYRITAPLIMPGVVSGALFAFATSFDEVVAVLFIGGPQQQTIPRQMWSGIREQVSPAILAVATILVLISILMLATLEALRRRSERMRTGEKV